MSRTMLLFRVRANAALDAAENPRQVLDFAAIQQREQLRAVRHGLIEVATARHSIERQVDDLQSRAERLEAQARQALAHGRDDLARVALVRKHDTLARRGDLARQLAEVAGDEQRLIAAERQVAQRVEDSARQRQLLLARFTAAEAQVKTAETLAGLSTDVGDLSAAVERASERTDHLRARAAALDALLATGALGASGSGVDDIERELCHLDSERAVEDELAAMKQALSL